MSLKLPSAVHVAFRNDCITMLNKHSGNLPAIEMLALSAHLLGQIVAMQDQRTTTKEMAMQTIFANIEKGNSEVIDALGKPQGQS